jgi:hypothetical protein
MMRDAVGAGRILSLHGLYMITMVKQMADDNHLRLTIR